MSLSGRIVEKLVGVLDRVASVTGNAGADAAGGDETPAHLALGVRGEEAAYFHLRRLGYVIVARNHRTPHRKSELDLIAWHEGVLCFIEVKTRSERGLVPAEAAVDAEKRRDLRSVARDYLRRHHPGAPARFDVVSVYLDPSQPGARPAFEMVRDAFPV